MIGLVHFCIPKPSSCCWAVSLFICRASHPGESSLWKTKTGVGMGSPCTTPVCVEGGIQFWGWFDQPPMRVSREFFCRHTHENHEVCRFRRWTCSGCLNLFLLVPISETFEISFSEFMQISKQACFLHGEVDDTDELIW